MIFNQFISQFLYLSWGSFAHNWFLSIHKSISLLELGVPCSQMTVSFSSRLLSIGSIQLAMIRVLDSRRRDDDGCLALIGWSWPIGLVSPTTWPTESRRWKRYNMTSTYFIWKDVILNKDRRVKKKFQNFNKKYDFIRFFCAQLYLWVYVKNLHFKIVNI